MSLMSLKMRFESLLERAIELHGHAQIYGTTSRALLALFLTRNQNPLFSMAPHLIVCPDDDICEQLVADFEFFSPQIQVHHLGQTETSPYSGLYPNIRLYSRRVGWLAQARHASGGDIFIASAQSLAQTTLPLAVFDSYCQRLKKGGVVDRDLIKKLRESGYTESPRVEDLGHFCLRGGIFDIFSPAHESPIRIELFGDTIESLRFFDPDTQLSLGPCDELVVCPAREVLYSDEYRQELVQSFLSSVVGRDVDDRELEVIKHDLSLGRHFPGAEFLLPFFYSKLSSPVEYFKTAPYVWALDFMDVQKAHDLALSTLKSEFESAKDSLLRAPWQSLLLASSEAWRPTRSKTIDLFNIKVEDTPHEESAPQHIEYPTYKNSDFRAALKSKQDKGEDLYAEAKQRILKFKEQGFDVFISTSTSSQAQRLSFLLEKQSLTTITLSETSFDIDILREAQKQNTSLVHIIPRKLSDSVRLPEEHLVFLNEDDFFSRAELRKDRLAKSAPANPKLLDFGDLKEGDYIVHLEHGVGIFDGLKVMSVQGIECEFLQLSYKDKDKLYLPVYRIGQIQKFSGVPTLDKLGSSSWQKTKIKVKSHLKDIASELLDLYAKRSQIQREPHPPPDEEYRKFEALFPYDETDDQLKAIEDVLTDLGGTKPMDRLICGDVGFGKTEIALRAAHKVAHDGKQVLVLVPTTVLALQHLETFRNRFKGLPIKIAGFSRLTDKADLKKNLEGLKSGDVDIAVGTHRLLSKDVEIKSLGLLIVDEEQRFGVTHKEKIKKLKTAVDTLTMTATPIPRTLNMSLMGLRDLSLINTAPRDRLPIRTFICKFEAETIRKSILSEVQRGGQVYYVHNRVQSIYSLADELRSLVPEVRIRVGHGQMEADELEDTMVAFLKHEFDVLLCTTIIESGVDVPRANTMIVDRADTFGLSQLYQLRGRIGRSKERAYCYLLIPKHGQLDKDAQERLKVLQENSSLGSGFKIAHHDLELRGGGNLLGEAQSGHVNAVGYELYLELLEQALKSARGDIVDDAEVEPDLNIRIPALIPDAYIADIRLRLAYYKQLTNIKSPYDIDKIETELRDQFGAPPEPVMNLFGVMLIRRLCKDLGVRDISTGPKSVSIAFSEKTKMPPQAVVDLSLRERKKYSLTPDSRLICKLDTITWPAIYDELVKLKKLGRID